MPRDRRRVRAVVAAALTLGVAVGLGTRVGATHVGLTDAAWVDREYVGAALGTRATWCDTGLYSTTGRGQLVAGTVGSGDTGTVAAVGPLQVVNPGTGASTTRVGATSAGAGTDAWRAPLTAADLQTTHAVLGSSVAFSGSLTPAHLGQDARASSTGSARGSAGPVTTAGVVDPATQGVGGGLPDLARVDVRNLVGPSLLSTTIGAANATDLTTLHLVTGTVASSTVRDACLSSPSLTRAYGVSGLRLEATSAALRAVSTQTTAAGAAAQAAVTGTGAGTVRATAAAGVNAVYRGNQALLNLMTPGTSTASLQVSVDVPTALAAVAGRTLGAGGPVRLDLSSGVLTVDVAALTSPTTGVNGLPPNTEVLTPGVMAAAASAVDALLPAHQAAVLSAIASALAVGSATLVVSTPLTLLGLGLEPSSVTFTGTLDQLHQKQGTVAVTVGAGNTCGLATTGSCTAVRDALGSAAGTAQLRQAVSDALTATVYGTTTASPAPASGQVVAAVAAAQAALRSSLAAVPSAVSAQVNVRGDVASPAARPGVALASGELGVTALRVGAVPVARTAWLAFGTSAAGPSAYRPPA